MTALDEQLYNGITPFSIDEEVMNQWQELANAMATLMNVPAGLIMRLKDERIEVFTTSETENNPYKVSESEHFYDSGLYCETVIRTNDRLHVPNALEDENGKTTLMVLLLEHFVY